MLYCGRVIMGSHWEDLFLGLVQGQKPKDTGEKDQPDKDTKTKDKEV